jgi:methylglyoxal synthase
MSSVTPVRIALVAHDAKKQVLADVLRPFVHGLRRCDLIATAGTGTLLREHLALDIRLVRSGPDGGDVEIAALAAQGQLSAVLFLRDPLTAQPHEPDIHALLRVCDVHDVPLATNPATASAILRLLLQGVAEA